MGKDHRKISNSSRAAQAIPIRFNAFALPNQEPSQSLSVSLNSSLGGFDQLPPQAQLLIKKTLKKDPVSRIKALDELLQYFDGNSAIEMLTVWENVFIRMAFDVDRQVRLTCFKAHEKIVETSGRNIAKIIKKIAAVWLFSWFDSWSDVGLLVVPF